MKKQTMWTKAIHGKQLEALFEGSEVEFLGYVGKQSFAATLRYYPMEGAEGEKILEIVLRAMDG